MQIIKLLKQCFKLLGRRLCKKKYFDLAPRKTKKHGGHQTNLNREVTFPSDEGRNIDLGFQLLKM